MGQTASRIKKFFCPEGTVTDTRDGETPSSVNSVRELLLDNQRWQPLATPRSPLIRNIGTITPPDTPVLPPTKKLKRGVKYVDYPVLLEEETIDYIQRNKVMMILKGLSGSGKSTLCKSIKQVYPDAVICSADHFFMVDGEYQFDVNKLKDAHESCQERAREAAEQNYSVIVIDNTNVRHWEYAVYLQICKEYTYVALILEPQTPWCFDPKELALRTSHGIDENFLAKKLKSYQKALPIYYAWFVNEPDSQMICKIAWQWLEKALLEVDTFFEDMSQFTQMETVEDMLQYYTEGNKTLHVTSKYTARGKANGAWDYINNAVVKGALGRCYLLSVIGYIITPRTFGARIQLTKEELELWGQNDSELPPDNMHHIGGFSNRNEGHPPQESTDNNGIGSVDCEDVDVSVDLGQQRVKVIPQNLSYNRFCPTVGEGSRAHFTLGYAFGVKPVTTGFDLMDIISCEQTLSGTQINLNEKDTAMDIDSPVSGETTHTISGAVLKSYGEGRWVIYPETKAEVETLFTGLY